MCKDLMAQIGRNAKAAKSILAQASSEQKNHALLVAAKSLRDRSTEIMAANAIDMAEGTAKGLGTAILDRLLLTPERIEGVAKAVEDIAQLPDPVGTVIKSWTRQNGLRISRVRVPFGVIGIIYESRPNVTADAGAICLKSGNTCILRGGSDSVNSSRAIHTSMVDGLKAAGLPEACIQLIPTQDRDAVGILLTMTDTVDIIIPRGGKSLVARVQAEARVPVLAHLDGICHVYVHDKADPLKALNIAVDAKMRRTGICGAMETLLIDLNYPREAALEILDALAEKGCELRGDEAIRAIYPAAKAATEEDWRTEYLDAILSVRLVDGVDQAVNHIETYGSHHTDAIVTEDMAAAEAFLRQVDSAIVLHNASTQFADGGEFGFGAEIGIATGKLHARGPVAVEELTTYKSIIHGTGQTRAAPYRAAKR
jgi:glutamate-5-semialdehyde dehydrogenase